MHRTAKRKGGAASVPNSKRSRSSAPPQIIVDSSSATERDLNKISNNLHFSCNSNANVDAIEQEAERLITQIKNGMHGELERRSLSLQKAKDRRIASCDRHRKMQIKNVNQMFEYEVEDANSIYKREFNELQNQLIAEVMEKKHRLQTLSVINSNAAKAVSVTDLHTSSSSNHHNNNNAPTAAGRSLRSTGPSIALSVLPEPVKPISAAIKRRGASSAASIENAVNTSSFPTSQTNHSSSYSSSYSAPLHNGTSLTPATLEYALPDSSMRADFLEIVRDMYQRALDFQKTKPKSKAEEIKLSADLSQLLIGEESFTLGDMVVIFSVLSQESFNGVITAISHRDVVVRTATGARMAFFVGQLRNGSVTVSKDVETIRNAEMIRNSLSRTTAA